MITTEKGFTTIANTKDGFIDSLKVSGKTLVSLFNKKSIKLTKSNSMLLNPSLFKPSTKYSFMVNQIESLFTSGWGVLITVQYPTIATEYFMFGGTGASSLINKYFCNIIPIRSENPTVISIGLHSSNDITSFAELSDLFIIEGDYTDKSQTYIEGLKSVGDGANKIEVLTCGKNINSSKLIAGDIYDSTGSVVPNATINSICDSFIRCKPSTIYKISCSQEPVSTYKVGYEYDCNYKFIQKTGFGTITTSPNCSFIKFKLQSSDNLNIEVQIEEGTVATTYKPYKADKKQLLYYNTENKLTPVTALRSVSDTIMDTYMEENDGVWRYRKKCAVKTFNGDISENWNLYAGSEKNPRSFYINLSSQTKDGFLYICDKYKKIKSKTENGIWQFDMNLMKIAFADNLNSFATVETWRNNLSSNPITVVYELAQEEVYECLPLTLDSYESETSIICDSGAISPKMEFELVDGLVDIVEVTGALVSELEHQKTRLYNILQNKDVSVLEGDKFPSLIDKVGNQLPGLTSSNKRRNLMFDFSIIKNNINNEYNPTFDRIALISNDVYVIRSYYNQDSGPWNVSSYKGNILNGTYTSIRGNLQTMDNLMHIPINTSSMQQYFNSYSSNAKKFELYDFQSDTITTPLLILPSPSALCSDGKYVYGIFDSKLKKGDLTTNSWTDISTCPTQGGVSSKASIGFHENKIYYVTISTDTENKYLWMISFDMKTQTWTQEISNFMFPSFIYKYNFTDRSNLIVGKNGNLYILGDTIWKFNITSKAFDLIVSSVGRNMKYTHDLEGNIYTSTGTDIHEITLL